MSRCRQDVGHPGFIPRGAIKEQITHAEDLADQVIRFIAGLIPWLVVIVPGIILVRLLWHGVSRWLARRQG